MPFENLIGQALSERSLLSTLAVRCRSARCQQLRALKREQGCLNELLQARAGWLYPIASEGPRRRAAAGAGRCAGRLDRDRTTLRRGIGGNGSRSRTDRDYVVA